MAVVGKFLITIPFGNVTGGPHTNFPVLIDGRVLDIPAGFWAAVAQADGSDIKFWSADELTEYDREIVAINTGTEEIEAWVRIPSMSGIADTEIMCRVEDTTRANDVGTWNADYVSVYHMQEASGNIINSKNPGTYDGVTANITYGATGKIGDCTEFNGSNSTITLGDINELDGTANFTYSAWVNQDVIDTLDLFFTKGASNDLIQFYTMTDGKLYVMVRNSDTNFVDISDYSPFMAATTWNMVHLVFDGGEAASANRVKLYINGTDRVDEQSGTNPVLTDANSANAIIGHATVAWDGKQDEVRIKGNTEGSDWINTEYDNQNDPDAFMNCGAWELASSSSSSISSASSESSESSLSSESSDSSESSSSITSASSTSVASVSVSSNSSASTSSDSSSRCVLTDCIQAQITADIKTKLRGITTANGYNYNVAAVEEARHTLEINDRYPFILILENEPEKEAEDDFFIRRLEYMLWFFSEQNDRNEGIDTEIAYYNRNAIADITKALSSVDAQFDRNNNAESTYILPGTHEMYIDEESGLSLFGTWCMVTVPCDIDARNPFFNR